MRSTAAAVLLLLAFAFPARAQQGSEITVESVLREMNVVRAEEGLPPLRSNPLLDLAAADRMKDMEELAYWSHQSPDGRSPFTWVRSRGYDFAYAGENLAAGFETAELMLESWMESKGHRANILSPIYNECGIAIIEGSTVRRTAGRSVVVLFARHQNPEPVRTAQAETPKPVPAVAPKQPVVVVTPPPPHSFNGSMAANPRQ